MSRLTLRKQNVEYLRTREPVYPFQLEAARVELGMTQVYLRKLLAHSRHRFEIMRRLIRVAPHMKARRSKPDWSL